MPKVIAQRDIGLQQTYDLEIDHPDHQFYLSNGLLTSNSHAISYALDSYMCAWLLTHHEAEWLCAYAEMAVDGEADKKRDRALGEIKSLGYSLTKIDINHATDSWTILPGKKFMPSFSSCKNIGSAAVMEILTHRPYKTVYDLLWNEDGSWKHSKFNKRIMENLIMIGAFDSMRLVGPGAIFANYRHMHTVLIENWNTLKRRNGRALLDELLATNATIDDWSRDEKVEMYTKLLGSLDLDLIISSALRENLTTKGVSSIDNAIEGETAIHWFVVTAITPKKTKNGKSYLFVNCVGESGQQHRMNIWGWKPGGPTVRANYAYLAEVEKSDFGLSTMPWKIREINA